MPGLDGLRFRLVPFDALELLELYGILHLRDRVFVVGQGITAEPEVDGRDPECHHVLCHQGPTLVGTARVFVAASPLMVGRIAVDPARQRCGVGTWMMRQIQAWLGPRPAEMHAQAYLEGWYARLGWARCGEPFVEAEIDHVPMRWPPVSR